MPLRLACDVLELSGGLSEVLARHQLEDQLVERALSLMVSAGKANQLTVEIHRVVTSLAVINDFLSIHGASFDPVGSVLPTRGVV